MRSVSVRFGNEILKYIYILILKLINGDGDGGARACPLPPDLKFGRPECG